MLAAITPLMVALPGLLITDGITDVAKGTHHYFGMNIWKKLTRNEEKKKQIEKKIKQHLDSREWEISWPPKK